MSLAPYDKPLFVGQRMFCSDCQVEVWRTRGGRCEDCAAGHADNPYLGACVVTVVGIVLGLGLIAFLIAAQAPRPARSAPLQDVRSGFTLPAGLRFNASGANCEVTYPDGARLTLYGTNCGRAAAILADLSPDQPDDHPPAPPKSPGATPE